jgi:hypothetical protein
MSAEVKSQPVHATPFDYAVQIRDNLIALKADLFEAKSELERQTSELISTYADLQEKTVRQYADDVLVAKLERENKDAKVIAEYGTKLVETFETLTEMMTKRAEKLQFLTVDFKMGMEIRGLYCELPAVCRLVQASVKKQKDAYSKMKDELTGIKVSLEHFATMEEAISKEPTYISADDLEIIVEPVPEPAGPTLIDMLSVEAQTIRVPVNPATGKPYGPDDTIPYMPAAAIALDHDLS